MADIVIPTEFGKASWKCYLSDALSRMTMATIVRSPLLDYFVSLQNSLIKICFVIARFLSVLCPL